jgi:hypothetical protein
VSKRNPWKWDVAPAVEVAKCCSRGVSVVSLAVAWVVLYLLIWLFSDG